MNTKLIQQERDKYSLSYKKWCELNPGYVMHNDGIRELACEQILLECSTIEDIKDKESIHRKKWDEYKGKPNGHFIIAETCENIIKLLENQPSIETKT